MEGHLRAGRTCDIRDANRRTIWFIGTIRLCIPIGTFLVQDEFLVCDRLGTPYILGTPLLDRYVLSPPERRIQLTKFSFEPIVCHPLPSELKRPNCSQAKNTGTNRIVRKDRSSIKHRLCRPAALESDDKPWVQVTYNKAGVLAIEPRGDLMNYSKSCREIYSVDDLDLPHIDKGIR